MAIISENKRKKMGRYGSTQFRYALTYVAITLVVLLFLNLYCANTSQQLFAQDKQASMLEKCQLAAREISSLEVLNTAAVSGILDQMGSFRVTRLMVTDPAGTVLYDSLASGAAIGRTALFPEVVQALQDYDVFTWRYGSGAMESQAAVPIFSYGTLTGCVYMMEYDRELGSLLRSLQGNIFYITLFLEIVVTVFSLFYAATFSSRLRRIMASMRIIREGDYSYKVKMGGHDELTVLGDEFNDLTERLQVSERKRRQFVSDASHELKTPLASIKLLADSILQNDMDMATVREFVGDIGSEADRLNRMSQKLLSLSRIDDQTDAECEIVCMAPTVRRVANMLSEIAKESQITLDLDLAQDSPILIMEDDLYQITFNLVENGIKYNLPGGKLTVTLGREEGNATLTVTDTGVGIPEDAIPHVFERFYRVDKARSRKSGGSGLGLSIVRNMVERNRGQIRVESQLGQGTSFTVSFPIFDVEEAP